MKKERETKPGKSRVVDVSIITVSHNGFDETCKMIESIQRHVHSVTYEIIVVDNASLRNDIPILRKKYPSVRILRSHEKINYASGYNLGATISNGKYLFFVNNDTCVKDDSLHYLVECMKTDHTIGGVCPMLCYSDEDALIQFAGFSPLTRYTLRNKCIGHKEEVDNIYMQPMEIPYLHGAAMMVKREVYERVGGIPTMYFFYFEEWDWSLAIQACGYKLWYEPHCVIYHEKSRGERLPSQLKVYYRIRNRFLFAYRNRTRRERFISHFYLLCGAFPKECLGYLMKKEYHLIRASISGVWDYFKMTKKEKITDYNFHFSYSMS